MLRPLLELQELFRATTEDSNGFIGLISGEGYWVVLQRPARPRQTLQRAAGRHRAPGTCGSRPWRGGHPIVRLRGRIHHQTRRTVFTEVMLRDRKVYR